MVGYLALMSCVFLLNTCYLHLVVFYISCVFFGLAMTISFTLLDSMLADIIDYDELISMSRNEALYTCVETNMQQFVEIIVGVVPLIIMGATGYKGNGGCECGCGVDCDSTLGMPYARWHCPNDIGYSCSGELGSPLLFRIQSFVDVAPCVQQNQETVWVIRVFFSALPTALCAVAAIAASKFRITSQMHSRIELEKRNRRENPAISCLDPLTGREVRPWGGSEEELLFEQLFSFERRMLEKQPLGSIGGAMKNIQLSVMIQCVGYIGVIAIVVAVMITFADNTLTTFGCLFLSCLSLFLMFTGQRLTTVQQHMVTSDDDKIKDASSLNDSNECIVAI